MKYSSGYSSLIRFTLFLYNFNPTFEKFRRFFTDDEVLMQEDNVTTSSFENNNTPLTVDSVTLSGTITWFDDNNVLHPAYGVRVEVLKAISAGVDSILTTAITDENGHYRAVLHDSSVRANQGRNIKIQVSTEGEVFNVTNHYNAIYKLKQNYSDNLFSGNTLTANLAIDPNDLSESERTIAYAFRVHQAIKYASDYIYDLSGSRISPVNVEFPTVNSTSAYSRGMMGILAEDKNDWDVIMHEYGHHVAACFNLSQGGGGTHYINDSLYEVYGKTTGMKIAWSEAFATFFSIGCQLHFNLSLLGVQNVGDSLYQDTEDTYLSFDLESPDPSLYRYGESQEVAIGALLFDLADGVGDDLVDFGYLFLWNVISGSNCNDIVSFINALYAMVDTAQIVMIGDILSKYNFAPSLFDVEVVSWGIPTFSWIPNGGVGQFENNSFSVIFYDEDMNEIYETEYCDSSQYIPSNDEWQSLLNSGENRLYWAVKTFQICNPISGPYYSRISVVNLPMPRAIHLNESVNGQISSGDADWYRFIPTISGVYEISTSGSEDTYGELFSELKCNGDSAGVIEYDDDGGEDYNFRIEINLNQGQTVFIRVRGYAYLSVEHYFLNIELKNHAHDYNYTYLNSRYHILSCLCGATIEEPSVHTIDSHSQDARYKPCIFCGALVDMWSGIFYPSI